MKLLITPELEDRLNAALDARGVELARRIASGRVSLWKKNARQLKNGGVRVTMAPPKTILDLDPEEAVLFGIAWILYGVEGCPEFCAKHFEMEAFQQR